MEEEQMSFFSDDSVAPENTGGKIDVAKLEFVEAQSTTWHELFSGFDTLKAITYSSSVGFVSNLIDLFTDAEILLGCEQVMSFTMDTILAFQEKTIEKIRSSKYGNKLETRIGDGSLRLFVANKKISHEKTYLLSAADGRKRVVLGSANMSYQAFTGLQRENIIFIDGDEAYDWYSSVYDTLRENCTDKITGKAVAVSDECDNVDEIPIAQTVKVNKVLEIKPDKSDEESVEFALDVTNLAGKYKPLMPKADKKGIIRLSPTSIVTMKSHIKENRAAEKEKRREYPQLVIDVDAKSVTLNGEKLNLNPSDEEIRNDVSLFLQYMTGYDKFHGDYKGMQSRYYEFANWFFCSPFMAQMRDVANRYSQNTYPYPMFGLIYGKSKAGKTTFLKTLLLMMIGQQPLIRNNEFTRTTINNLRCEVKGAPIIVDDLVRDKFNQHAVETIKNDYFGYNERMVHYPAVVISANEDVKSVGQEVIRRTVICHVQAGLTNTELMSSNMVKKVQKNIGTAFYREYLRRMLECVPDLIDMMKDDECDSAPDIMKVSSEVMYDILSMYSSEDLPFYVRKLTMDDYFSERVTGKQAIQAITIAWRTSRNCFVINKNANELRYNAGQSYDADRIIRELPETLEATKSREWIIMRLDEAKKFFGIKFSNSLWSRIKK